MEQWRLGKLIETDDETGRKTEIGGDIVRMRIGGVNGPLDMIDIKPVSIEDMQSEGWEDSYVRFQVADRVVWLDPDEARSIIELMELALEASFVNYDKAFPAG